MLRTLITAVATLAATAASAVAQDLTPTHPDQEHAVFLVGATVHTVSGETIENGVVGFNGGRITVVGDVSLMSRISLSPDTEVIDLNGMHVYPGLIAAYTRLGLTEVGAVRATLDFNEAGSITPEARAIVAVNPDSTLIPVTRLSGVLVAGVFPQGGRIAGTPGVIRTDGWTWEDMAIDQNNGLVLTWPNVRPSTNSWSSDSESDQLDRINDSLRDVNDLFDSAIAYAAARATQAGHPTDLALESMLRVIPGDHLEGAEPEPVYINANDVDQIVSAVRWATGRGLRPIIVGGRDAPLAAEILTSTNTHVIVRGTFGFPKREDAPYDDPFTLPQRLEEAGIDFSLSSTNIDWNSRNLAHNAGKAVAHGLDHERAVRAITLDAARALGIDADYGSIDRGKSATLIVTDGDVLELSTLVVHAFIDGRRVDLRSKQTDLADLYHLKYEQLNLIGPRFEDAPGD